MTEISKLLNTSSLTKIRKKFKKKKIVLCHGVFDLLHVGHINYFKAAKSFGDILVVSVTDDNHVNKGPGRPAFSISNRIKFLQEISSIDFVYISSFDTAVNVIENLKPNFYCKGFDYSSSHDQIDQNLKKEKYAINFVKGKFKIINQPSFSSSKFINDNDFQNLNIDGKKFIEVIRKKYGLNNILETIKKIENKKVLVIGETIIDKYVETESIGKSGKEPVLVVKQLKEINFLGGASYISNLCASFVKKIKILSFLGSQNTKKKICLKKFVQ